MGIFDFLKKKEKVVDLTNNSYKQTLAVNSMIELKKIININYEIKDLVWIGDGTYCNYNQVPEKGSSFIIGDIIVNISFMDQEEPSLIYTIQNVRQPKPNEVIRKNQYFSSYSKLPPEQKWNYLTFLADPYDASADIGYVFILYYGLERHLLCGDYERAIDVIIKLRDVHTNKSFQAYSGNAIIVSCMIHQRPDLILKFIESLDNEYKLSFSDNLLLLCYRSFKLPLFPDDIIRMRKSFEFDKTNYIQNYPDMFSESMKEIIENEEGVEYVELSKYITDSDIKKAMIDVTIYANISIRDKSITVPNIIENYKFKKQIYNYLEMAHEAVENKLNIS